VLAQTVADLQSPISKKKAEARLAVQSGALGPYLDLLDLSDWQRRRVEHLLCELAG
jgi:hypothetical protein